MQKKKYSERHRDDKVDIRKKDVYIYWLYDWSFSLARPCQIAFQLETLKDRFSKLNFIQTADFCLY